MKKTYRKDVLEALERTNGIKKEILTENDIQHLPAPVRKYIHYSGSIGKEKVLNFRVEFSGGIRSSSSEEFMPLRSVQYNFTDQPTRLFYIVAKKKGIPAKGIHIYKDRKAIMLIKILGLFTVVDARGKEMDQGETVTVFNDMCFMAPASLIDRNIEWEEIDDLTVGAIFTNGNITIGATLYFNEKGELVNINPEIAKKLVEKFGTASLEKDENDGEGFGKYETGEVKDAIMSLLDEVAAHDRVKDVLDFVRHDVLKKPEINYKWDKDTDALVVELVRKEINQEGKEIIAQILEIPF